MLQCKGFLALALLGGCAAAFVSSAQAGMIPAAQELMQQVMREFAATRGREGEKLKEFLLQRVGDELGIAEDTLVLYSTDNGPHFNTWPDAGITPFRSEKNTNWEGGWRVPAFVRWPSQFKADTVLNDIVSHQDWMPTLL